MSSHCAQFKKLSPYEKVFSALSFPVRNRESGRGHVFGTVCGTLVLSIRETTRKWKAGRGLEIGFTYVTSRHPFVFLGAKTRESVLSEHGTKKSFFCTAGPKFWSAERELMIFNVSTNLVSSRRNTAQEEGDTFSDPKKCGMIHAKCGAYDLRASLRLHYFFCRKLH